MSPTSSPGDAPTTARYKAPTSDTALSGKGPSARLCRTGCGREDGHLIDMAGAAMRHEALPGTGQDDVQMTPRGPSPARPAPEVPGRPALRPTTLVLWTQRCDHDASRGGGWTRYVRIAATRRSRWYIDVASTVPSRSSAVVCSMYAGPAANEIHASAAVRSSLRSVVVHCSRTVASSRPSARRPPGGAASIA